MKQHAKGFTLIELIVIMIVVGVLSGSIAIFVKPAMESYVDSGRRTTLTDLADGAMRRIKRDIRMSVPNSFRQSGSTCLEMVPTSGGGRFRTAADPNDASSQPLDTSAPGTSFDVVMGPGSAPAATNLLVIGNQSPEEVYSGSNVNTIAQVATHPAPAAAGAVVLGTHRITLNATAKYPLGYEGGRFVLVPAAQQAVFYRCNNGVLTRFSNYVPNPVTPANCTPPANASSAIVATHLSACSFNLNPNPGITQDSGFIELQLTLSDTGSNVTLIDGAHADNMP
ncbi:prepilin-type N-terminal cleavage/methylation domain-containing protein [Massilia sp. erpn]|uniref:prepilin-type N-terminal cleavage/methylation domain-containing protein n=1 Tax=Massilia sp. erpn TaxID=2738142 RepID=UPI002107C21B|nr:prepilin-type N-terminal cleavage/methylation domain-containing protein [Massilia sp. erpn]UTY59874.1 prepilin-type N-terminal cleavage/methylation domain-containing protein [Massilia sp. erpn]